MSRNLFIIFTIALISLVQGSVLSSLAASLSARKWGLMPTNGSLSPLTLDYSLLYWNDSGVWDPVKKKIRWVGGPGTCCVNPANYKMITYDVEANTWALNSTPFSGSGHAYDANAFNPNAGLHYFGLIGSSTLHVWNDTAWTTLPDAPFSSTTPSLTWFPDINGGKGGLVFLGDGGNLAWYDGSKWTRLSSVSLSGYNGFSQYNPVQKAVWLGGCGGQANYLLDANLSAKRLKDAPFSLANGSTMQTCDPTGGKFLVYNYSNNQWWELNPASDTWTQVSDMAPKFSLANAFHVPIPEYGAILVFNFSTPVKSVYVYKHSATAGVEGRRAPAPIAGVAGSTAGGPLQWRVYDLQGRRVAKISGGGPGTAFNASRLPAGLYVQRASANGRWFEKKLIVAR